MYSKSIRINEMVNELKVRIKFVKSKFYPWQKDDNVIGEIVYTFIK